MSALHMVSLRLDAVRVFRAQGLPRGCDDHGYLVHSQLSALFADLVGPFFLEEQAQQRHFAVLAYSAMDAGALSEHAQRFAEPQHYAACDWEELASKPMPEQWPAGGTYRFQVRVVPTVRAGQATERHRKGAERDAFLAAADRAGTDAPLNREVVYIEWLRERIQAAGAELLGAHLKSFQLTRLMRKTQGAKRTQRVMQRPDACFVGTLRVIDPTLFAERLGRGVGRHRAFGYGMLLLSGGA